MAEADVIGGQGEPGAVRVGDAVGYLVHQGGQVLGAAVNAQHRVQAVADADLPRRLFGQHHQPAHAGVGARRILPVGLLVADGSQQAPVKAELGRGIHEIRLQFLQPVVIAVDEAACFHVIELVGKHVYLVDQAGQLALAPDMVVELPDRPDEGIIPGGAAHGPAQGFGIGQVEGHPKLRQGDARVGHLVGPGHGVEDLPVLDHLQQIQVVLVLVHDQDQVRVECLQAVEFLPGQGIAGHVQPVRRNPGQRGRADIAVPVHYLPGYPLKAGAECQGIARRQGPGQPGCRDVRLSRHEQVGDLLPAVRQAQLEIDAQPAGKQPHQFVFQAAFPFLGVALVRHRA